jgi:hypothetical protein
MFLEPTNDSAGGTNAIFIDDSNIIHKPQMFVGPNKSQVSPASVDTRKNSDFIIGESRLFWVDVGKHFVNAEVIGNEMQISSAEVFLFTTTIVSSISKLQQESTELNTVWLYGITRYRALEFICRHLLNSLPHLSFY